MPSPASSRKQESKAKIKMLIFYTRGTSHEPRGKGKVRQGAKHYLKIRMIILKRLLDGSTQHMQTLWKGNSEKPFSGVVHGRAKRGGVNLSLVSKVYGKGIPLPYASILWATAVLSRSTINSIISILIPKWMNFT